jgi:hypothetical protein
MYLWRRSRIRHPFFPGLKAVRATQARGRCTALAGSFEELVRAACAGVRVERAVFVVTLEGEPLPDDFQHDELWELFGTPVFALLLDHRGRLVGCECEAQRGLHVLDGAAPAGTLETAPCECGRPGNRIIVEPPAEACRLGGLRTA